MPSEEDYNNPYKKITWITCKLDVICDPLWYHSAWSTIHSSDLAVVYSRNQIHPQRRNRYSCWKWFSKDSEAILRQALLWYIMGHRASRKWEGIWVRQDLLTEVHTWSEVSTKCPRLVVLWGPKTLPSRGWFRQSAVSAWSISQESLSWERSCPSNMGHKDWGQLPLASAALV